MNDRTGIRVVVDAMGGDLAPAGPVHGAALVSTSTNIEVVLVGEPRVIAAHLKEVAHEPTRIHVVAAHEVVGMHEKPRAALDAKPDASIAVAARVLARGEAAALVSAGSTGALVLAASDHVPKIEGVERAALAAVVPTARRSTSNDRFTLVLDVGATVHCRPRDLLFFAYMGHAYASRISKVAQPSVGLLNVGSEPGKGDAILQEAYRLMAEDPALSFAGNIEGSGIVSGAADVVVCEGYVGNVSLKMAEGMSETLAHLGKWAFKQSLAWRLGLMLLARGLRHLKHLTDYREYGGAPLLGFAAPIIKAHGRSGPVAIANAIKVAAKAARDGVCPAIEGAIAQFFARQGDVDVASDPV